MRLIYRSHSGFWWGLLFALAQIGSGLFMILTLMQFGVSLPLEVSRRSVRHRINKLKEKW